MRYVSPFPGLRLTLRGQKIERLADGNWRETRPGIYAQFLPQMFNEREREVAFARFGNKIKMGSRMMDETMTEQAPQDWRIGVFDTTWVEDDTVRAETERLLSEHRKNGLDFIAVEIEKLAPPWKTYDKLTVRGQRTVELVVKEILRIAEETGTDYEEIAAYERENLDREEVLAALVLEPAEKEIVVAA